MATQKHATTPVKLLLTVPQAAAALGLGRSVIYELLLAGELSGIKIGRARRIPVRSLEVFIARRMAKERTA
jgi:excisionase family DNA binding protein